MGIDDEVRVMRMSPSRAGSRRGDLEEVELGEGSRRRSLGGDQADGARRSIDGMATDLDPGRAVGRAVGGVDAAPADEAQHEVRVVRIRHGEIAADRDSILQVVEVDARTGAAGQIGRRISRVSWRGLPKKTPDLP